LDARKEGAVTRCIHFTAASLLTTVAFTATAQRPDSLTGELRRTFRDVRAVHELHDGRALVLDSHERFVYLADFRTGETHVIGEQGSADRQYLWPSRLLHRAPDTTLVWDAIEGRVHVVDWVGGEAGIRASIPRSAFPYLQRPFNPIESDDQGRLYSEVPIGEGGNAVVRWSPRNSRLDTLFRFRRNTVKGVFPASDRWVVSATGLVAYVHVSPYRVDLRPAEAAVVVGKPIAFDPKPVTPALQNAWTWALREPQIVWSQMRGEPPQFTESNDSPVDYSGPWPLFTPAIVAKRPLMQFMSDGSLLIERVSVPRLPSEYDVIDERAELKDRFELPAGSNIVATGRDAVYVTVRTAVNPLRRFKLQRFTVRRQR
jgi:hypothetical protein